MVGQDTLNSLIDRTRIKKKRENCCPDYCFLKTSLPHWQISQENYFELPPSLTFQKIIIAILQKLSFDVAPELHCVLLDISDAAWCKDSER